MKSIVLLSGGMDSAVCLFIARERGEEVCAVSFDYGQRHCAELAAAQQLARVAGVPHEILKVPQVYGREDALTGDVEVRTSGVEGGIPATFVPGRNLIFLSLALGYAAARGIDRLYIGVNAVDYSGYPDCRPEFIQSFVATATYALGRAWLDVQTPLLRMTKADIVREALRLDVPIALTVTCYRATPQGLACGVCDACRLRRAGFEAAGAVDPARPAGTFNGRPLHEFLHEVPRRRS